MMQLGVYQFSVNTAAYQDLRRSSEYRWKNQERVGQLDALQYTGQGSDTITLSGVVFPGYKGGTGQLNAMRAQAGTGQPLLLVDGQGFIHGRWVIEKIDEQQAVFARAGVPRRQQFSLQLRKYDNGPNL
jgi:phage protein U